MAIWMGDWLHERGPLDQDRLVLIKSLDDKTVYAQEVVSDGERSWFEVAFVWTGEVPPEHPDDVATDRRLAAEIGLEFGMREGRSM